MQSRRNRSPRLTRTPGLLGAALAVWMAFAPSLSAQIADAVIEVAAVDESGAALPGVTVTLARPDTGFQQTVVTDSVVVARVVALPPGS